MIERALLLLALIEAACGKGGGDPPPEKPIEWHGLKFTAETPSELVLGAISVEGGALVIESRSEMVTSVQVGDQTQPSGGKLHLRFPITSALGELPLAGGTVSLSLGLPIAITTASKAVVHGTIGTVSVTLASPLDAFKPVLEGQPVTFAADVAPVGKTTVVYGKTGAAVAGAGTKLRDVVSVATFAPGAEHGSKTCEYEKRGPLKVVFHDTAITLRDRRTGKVTETATMPPWLDFCPTLISVRDIDTEFHVEPDLAGVRDFLSSR